MTAWPGCVAATVVLAGCSFRCPYCSMADLIAPDGDPLAWAAFTGHLHAEAGAVEGVVVTGGEPADDPDLAALLARLKDRGLAVRLETNGSRPAVLRHLMSEGLVDFVALDIKTSLDRYDALSGVEGSSAAVAESIAVLRSGRIDHEFRTTLFPGAVSLADLEPLAASLSGGRLWAIQQYSPGLALDKRARGIDPYATPAVRSALPGCRRHVPTIIRGFAGVSA